MWLGTAVTMVQLKCSIVNICKRITRLLRVVLMGPLVTHNLYYCTSELLAGIKLCKHIATYVPTVATLHADKSLTRYRYSLYTYIRK